jgi:hypothetical protein
MTKRRACAFGAGERKIEDCASASFTSTIVFKKNDVFFDKSKIAPTPLAQAIEEIGD